MKKTILPTTAATLFEGQDPKDFDIPEGVEVQVVKRKFPGEAAAALEAEVAEAPEEAEEKNVSSVAPAKKATVKKKPAE